jgi:hypothetical protein
MIQDNYSASIWPLYTVLLSDSTSVDLDVLPVGDGGSAFWFYEASRGSVRRSGFLETTWNSGGDSAELVNLSTDKYDERGVGNSTDLAIEVLNEGSDIVLKATSVNSWTIKYKRLLI